MKKVLIVSSSLRAKSNSRVLAEKFAEGAREAGNEVELIAIKDLNLKFCIGCMSCQKTKKCVLSDSMNSLYDKFQNAAAQNATEAYAVETVYKALNILDRAVKRGIAVLRGGS